MLKQQYLLLIRHKMEAGQMSEFDRKYHELLNAVNSVLFYAPSREFTMDELMTWLKNRLPADISSGDLFFATEMLKGAICDLVLNGSIRKIDDDYYLINEN